jgi:pimeloyl-ACP methyl ester carboxylesterase
MLWAYQLKGRCKMMAHSEKVQQFRPLTELVPAHWQSGVVTSDDGARLHYTRTGGDKPALLLLHGVQVDGMMWLRTAKALESAYDVVMPDFRGHGQSGGLDKGASAERMVNDTIAIIHALRLDKPFVVGHSMGADVAGRLAAAHPLRTVVLVDPALMNFMPAAMMSGDTLPPYMQPIVEAMQAIRTQPHAERMVTGLRLLPPGIPLWDEADYVSFVEGQGRFDPAFFRQLAALGNPLFESPDVIARIACPILLFTARPMMPGANIEPGLAAFKNHWRNGQHIHFDDSGHFIPFDQFEGFIEVVTAFLRGQ